MRILNPSLFLELLFTLFDFSEKLDWHSIDYLYDVYQDSVLVDLAAGSDISSTKGLFWDLFLTVEFVELVQELLEQAEDEEMLRKKIEKYVKNQ